MVCCVTMRKRSMTLMRRGKQCPQDRVNTEKSDMK